MSSIVMELQAEAMDESSEVKSLLRKSLAVATKLQLTDWILWSKSELSGYESKAPVPDYRQITGALKMWNPFNRMWVEFAELGSLKSPCRISVAEIQALVKGDGVIAMTVPAKIYRNWDIITPPKLVVSKAVFIAVLDAVRNTVLEWTLKLEADGILGEGMTFNAQEKRTAMHNITNYHIGTLNGVLGDVSGENIQIGDYNQIDSQLKSAGVSAEARTELRDLMEAVPSASPSKKANIVGRGIAWAAAHSAAIGTLSHAIHEWFSKQ